jgi:hypothetical protein
MPPFFWASAMTCNASVVLPDDSARKSRRHVARHAADTQRVVDADRAGRNRLNRGDDVVLAEVA